MTPEEARGYIDGLSSDSKQDVWGEFPSRYDHWDAFEAFATIAGLRYEYAVQGPGGRWVRETDEGKLALAISPMRALRHYHPRIIEQLAEVASAQFNGECRVVRRLATDWEVAE